MEQKAKVAVGSSHQVTIAKENEKQGPITNTDKTPARRKLTMCVDSSGHKILTGLKKDKDKEK